MALNAISPSIVVDIAPEIALVVGYGAGAWASPIFSNFTRMAALVSLISEHVHDGFERRPQNVPRRQS